MTPAASRRHGAAVLALAALLALLGLALTTRSTAAQDLFCQRPDGTFVPCDLTTTTEDDGDATSTTEDDGDSTSTTEDTVDDTDTTQDTVGDDRGDDAEEEVVTQSTITVSTLRNVLIPGDGTEGAENTTTTAKQLASGSGGLSDEQLILLVVGGLGLVAAVAGVLTWRYWTATRPTVAEAPRGR